MGSRRSRSSNNARWPELRGGVVCSPGLSASRSCASRLARGPTSAPLPGARPVDDAPAPRLLPGLAEVAGPEPPRPTPPVPPLAEVLVDPAAAAAAAGDVCATAHTQPIAAEATRAQANLEDRHFGLRIKVSSKDGCCQYEDDHPSRAVARLQMDTGRQPRAAAGLQECACPRKRPAMRALSPAAGTCIRAEALSVLPVVSPLIRAQRAAASRTLAAQQCHCFQHGGTRPADLQSTARVTATC